MIAGLSLESGYKVISAGADVCFCHLHVRKIGFQPDPVFDCVRQAERVGAGLDDLPRREHARGAGVVGVATLVGAAIAVTQLVDQVEGAVENVGPALASEMPHLQRLGPAIGMKLDRDAFLGRRVFGHDHVEGDGRAPIGVPGFHGFLDGGWLLRDDELPHLESPAASALAIPESISQSIFVTDIGPDRQRKDHAVASIGERR